MYFLVTLADVPDYGGEEPDHEPFIDSLGEQDLVLLGGPVQLPGGVSAAYVLRCRDLDRAQAVVATDPLVTSGAVVPTVAQWDLVGINLAAIDE